MKRIIALLVVLTVMALPLMNVLAQDENPLRADDPFWNAGEDQFAAWNVVEGVEDGAEITFWTMSLSPTFDEYINKIVENFEATYPGVDVTWQDQPWDSLQDSTRAALTTGGDEAPDVINISPVWIAEFAEAGQLLDMDAALADYPDLRAEYSDGAWNTLTYGGASYQVPWYLGLTNFMAYNAEVLEALGVTPDQLPTNWAELRDLAATVRENSDLYLTSINFGSGIEQNMLAYLLYNDIPALDETGACALNSEGAADALQVWVDLIQEDLVPRESVTDDHRAMVDRFSQGETGLMILAPHMLRLVAENNPEVAEQLVVVPGVTGTSGKRAMDVQSLVIPADTPYPNAALALSLFVTNAETQAAFAKEVGIYPSNLLSYEDGFFQTTGEDAASAIRPLALEYVTNAENRLVSFPNDAEVQQAIIDAQNAALLGEAEPQAALDDLCVKIDELIAAAE